MRWASGCAGRVADHRGSARGVSGGVPVTDVGVLAVAPSPGWPVDTTGALVADRVLTRPRVVVRRTFRAPPLLRNHPTGGADGHGGRRGRADPGVIGAHPTGVPGRAASTVTAGPPPLRGHQVNRLPAGSASIADGLSPSSTLLSAGVAVIGLPGAAFAAIVVADDVVERCPARRSGVRVGECPRSCPGTRRSRRRRRHRAPEPEPSPSGPAVVASPARPARVGPPGYGAASEHGRRGDRDEADLGGGDGADQQRRRSDRRPTAFADPPRAIAAARPATPPVSTPAVTRRRPFGRAGAGDDDRSMRAIRYPAITGTARSANPTSDRPD